MIRSVPVGALRALGDRAFLIGVEHPAAGRAVTAALRRLIGETGFDIEGLDIVVGSGTVLVSLLDPAAELEELRPAVAQAQAETGVGAGGGRPRGDPGRLVTVPCVFDGPDLDEVARAAGCSPDAVAAHVTAAPLSVSVLGFSPGFAYLDGLPEPLRAVPRRAHPRPVVPAGSVAIANGYAAIYPTASPGGWQLVGRTGVPLFFPDEAPYAVLAPGDRVLFKAAGPSDAATPPQLTVPAWTPPANTREVVEVVTPGLRAVLQDGGRRSVAAAGVPWAGPADPVSFTLANRLVGNRDDAAALEMTIAGLKLRGLGDCHVAVVGASPDLWVDGDAIGEGRVTPLRDGTVLEIRSLRAGCRTYVAVAGGFVGPRLFGSVATDQLSGLGPGALVPGQRLHAGPWSPPLGDHLVAPAVAAGGAEGGTLDLHVVPGPHPEGFGPDALERLADCEFTVDASSNRVGLRLLADGPAAVPRPSGAVAGGLDSHGVVTGVVQVPAGGQPVVLLPDHATLGGYPVLAVVASADHGRLGQCAPGSRVRLVPIDLEGADAARRALRRAMDGAVVGHYPLAAG
jgi:KipI family sensor histidine kinase inhibitor